MPHITKNPTQRVSLSAFSFIGQTVFAIIVTAVAMPLIEQFSQANPSAAYWKTAAVIGVVSLIFALLFVFTVKEKSAEEVSGGKAKIPIGASLKSIVRNKQFLIVASATLLVGIGFGMHNASLAQYIIFGLQKPEITSVLVPLLYVGTFAAGVLAQPLARFGKLRMVRGAFIIIGVGLLVRMLTKDVLLPIIIGGELLIGFGGGLVSVYVVAMLMDTADYGFKITKVRNDALVMSSSTFQQKIGQGIGGAILGFWLQAGGYVSTEMEQPQSAVDALFQVQFIPFLIVVVICLVLLMFYKLDEKRMAEILSENAIAEGNAGSGGESEYARIGEIDSAESTERTDTSEV